MWHLFDDDYIKNDILVKLKKQARLQSITKNVVPQMIFICGKQILNSDGTIIDDKILEKENNKRYYFIKELFNRTIIAEDNEEYNTFIPIVSEALYLDRDKHILDLLTFENILANISDSILLILESPGAICELGAFAAKESLTGKLCIINDFSFENKESFITQGPIRRIYETNEKVIYVDDLVSKGSQFLKDFRLMNYIREMQEIGVKFTPNKSKKVNIKSLIYELLSIVWYFGPITHDELFTLYKEIKLINGIDFDTEVKKKFSTTKDVTNFLININLLTCVKNNSRLLVLHPSHKYAWFKILFSIDDYREASRIRLEIMSIYSKKAPERMVREDVLA